MTVFEELCAFTGLSPEIVRARMDEQIGRTARLFEEHDGPPEVFYRTTDAYLFELANWEPDPNRQELARLLGAGLKGGVRLPALEYGCGIGSFALELAEAGFRVTACDVNELAMDFLRYRIERRGWADRIEPIAPEEALTRTAGYAVVSCQHVLEHVDDPAAVLRGFHRCLAPGGVFLGIAPFDMIGPAFPEHDPKNADLKLEELCAGAGLRVQDVLPFGSTGSYEFHLVYAVKEARPS